MRAKAPSMLTRMLTPAQVVDVTRWWRGLAPGERRSLRAHAGRMPAGTLARFVEATGESADERGADFYEYLVNHEITLDDGRRFHICTAHPEARAAVRAARIPASFRCPRADVACPMRALVDAAGGGDVYFARAESPGCAAAASRRRL